MNLFDIFWRGLIFFALAGGLTSLGFGQNPYSKRHLPGVRTATPPIIDGNINDPCWATAAKAETFVDIQNGNPVVDQTTVYVLYDDKYIYAAFDCRDSHPELIEARETVRDTKFQQTTSSNTVNLEDNIEIDFDPFRSFLPNDISQFSVNAIGTRSAQLAGGRGSKAEWKGDWDAAVKRTPTGWTCEIRIPWQSLNYPVGKSAVSMGIDFQRFQNRTKDLSMWSNITTQGFIEREGVWDNVQVPQTAYRPKVSVLPYLLTGIQNGETSSKVGIDSRYTVTPQLTAVGSYNPDFSTIQDAIQSIQFSHVQRAVPDQRPFFLEGGNNFLDQTNINDIGLFFYPVSIPTFDLGAKMYGKIDSKDTVGVLDTDSFSGSNDFVGRLEHTFNQTSSGGAMVVADNSPFGHNTVGVLDDHQRWGKFAFETVDANSSGPGAGGGAQVVSTYYADKYLTSLIQYSGISSDFLTPLGYIPYSGYRGFTGVEDWSAQWRHGPLRSTEFTVVPVDWEQMNGLPYYRGAQVAYNVETRTDWHFELDAQNFQFENTFDRTIGFNIVSGTTNRFHTIGLTFTTGELGSVPSTAFGPTVTVRMLKKLDLSYGGYIQNRAGLTQQHIVTANYELSPTKSFGARMVAQNADTDVYFFYHNSGGKGTEFYLILGDPNTLRTVKSIQAKFVFSFG